MNGRIVYDQPQSPISEAYRSMRTNIQFINADKKLKTIMITSPNLYEGKTTTASNLAITLGDVGHKVLLLDCDLRSPSIHKVFELGNRDGISDIVLKDKDYREYVHSVMHKNVKVITAGKIISSPSELLDSEAMRHFIAEVRQEYDYIIVDSPSVLAVTDVAIMSTYMDGVIMVCTSGKTEVDAAKEALESLSKVEANIIGVVLNKIPVESKQYKDYYYYLDKSR